MPSAPDKNSISSASSPISAQTLFAARMLRLHVDHGVGGFRRRLGREDAVAPSSGLLRHCVIWLEWTTFALKAELWLWRTRLNIYDPVHGSYAAFRQKIPPCSMSRFSKPALSTNAPKSRRPP